MAGANLKVIISDTLPDNFSNFIVLDDFQWVEENMKDISTLIFHSSKSPDFTVGVHISKLSQLGITKQYLYINNNPQTTIKMVISGAGGHIITDEFYLEDEEELLELLNTCDDTEEATDTSLAVASVNVVKEFIQSFVRGEEKIKTPAYLEMVNDAINQLSTITTQQELQITTMGNSAIDIFKKASDLIKNMEANRQKIENQLKLLESSKEDSKPTNAFNSNVLIYPQVHYMEAKPLLLVREYSPCRFLTSFILGYTHHVHFIKNKRVKLIVVHQKGAGVLEKYQDFTCINETSASYQNLYTSELIATNTPTKDIMRTLFKQPVDAFIVVDRLYGNTNIVDGHINLVNAVGGLSDLDRYNIKAEDTLISMRKSPEVNPFATLIGFKDYPNDRDSRMAMYQQSYEKIYNRLDELMGIADNRG